jgi:hypothetical protein
VPEERVDGYDNNAAALSVTPLIGEQYATFAVKLAADNIAKLVASPACVPGPGDDTCATNFIRSFGKRAFRRPLGDDEVVRLLPLYRGERLRTDHLGGLRLVVEAMLQAPQFLYRFERGMAAGAGVRMLGPYEVASALSYLMWSAPPDAALMAAADASKLASPAELDMQARRLLASPRSRLPLRRFFAQWLALHDLDQLAKDTKVYPLSGEMLRDIPLELNLFLDQVIWKEDASLTTLLTTPRSFVNARLQGIYGLTGFKDDTLVLTPLNPAQRAGLLTMSGLLAKHSKPRESFPIARGKLVRESFLCQDLPNPPQNINVTPIREIRRAPPATA